MFDVNSQPEEIKKILNYTATDKFFISLYLEVDASKITKKDYLSKLNSMIIEKKAEIEKNPSINNSSKKALFELFSKIKDYFDDYFRPEDVKTVLLFVSEDGKWVAVKLPVNIKSKIIVDPKPHTQILRTLINTTVKYGILEIDREKAQVYLMQLGEITEGFAAFISNVPPRVKYRREGSDRERQQWGKIEVKLNHFFKIINDELALAAKEGKFDKLILAGRKDIVSKFKNYMNSDLQSRYIGSITPDFSFSPQSLKESAVKLINQVEATYKNEMVNKLIEEYKPTEWGVVGLEHTLNYLMFDQVRVLIYEIGFEFPGYVCEKCNFMTVKEQSSCPYCGGKLVYYNDITDEIIETALNQGCELLGISENQKLKDAGSIGAILRFKITA
jgi:peptide subunit release factor 1 (eRF1)